MMYDRRGILNKWVKDGLFSKSCHEGEKEDLYFPI